MGRVELLKTKAEAKAEAANNLIASDLDELKLAAKKLIDDAGGFTLAAAILQWVSSIAAIYLLILDRTNWRTNMLTSLLVPYIFLTLPSVLFYFLRGEVGIWIAFIAVIVKLFFPRQHYPDWLEIPVALILLLVVAPSFFADFLRESWIGMVICLFIAIYLLQEHIRAAGGLMNAFTQGHGASNTFGIILLLLFPVWSLILLFF